MKTLSILCLFFIGLVTNIQNEKTSKAMYDGYFEGTYSFTIEGGDDFIEETIVFNEVPRSILEEYDLQSTEFDGQHFSITYTTSVEKTEDEEGEEIESVTYNLVSLKKD